MAEECETCPACAASLHGRWCHACGQDTHSRPRPLRELVAEAFSETSPLDTQVARTLGAMAARPARLLNAYRRGAGGRYASPVKVFVVVTALFLGVLNLTDVVIYQYVRQPIPGQTVTAWSDPDGATVHVRGATEADLWMQRRVDTPIHPDIPAAMRRAAEAETDPAERANLIYEIQVDREQAIISRNLAAWLPNAIWLLAPLHALLLWRLFGRRRLFMEHMVFALWAHATAFLLLMLLALVNRFGANLPAWPLAAPYLAYLTVAAAGYYDLSLRGAAWRAMVHTALYFALVLTPAVIVVMLASMDWRAFVTYLLA